MAGCLLNRFKRSPFATTAGATVAVAVVSGIGGVIATRALGPYERGLLATAVAWSAVIASLAAYGIPQAATYFVAREPAERARFASTLLALATAAGVALAAAGAAGSLIAVGGAAAEPLAIAFAAQLPVILAGAGVGAVLGLGQYRAWGAFRLLAPALALGGIIVVTTSGLRTAVAIVGVTAAASTVQAVVLVGALRRRGLWARPSRRLVAPIVSYMWRNVVSGMAWLVSYRLDQLFLSIVVAPQLLGFYAVAASFVAVIIPIAGSAGQVMLRRAAAGDRRAVRGSLPRALATCLLIAGGLGVGVFVAAPVVVRLLFGEPFLPTVEPLRILLVGGIALSVSSVLADTLRGLGRPLAPARAELIGAAATLVLLLALVPSLGIQGAAIASSVSYALAMAAMALNLRAEMRRADPGAPAAPAPG